MTDQHPAPDTESSPDLIPAPRAGSRRALLAGALGGLGAWVAAVAARVSPARAAAGSPLIVGSEANNAGTSDTQLIANSDVVTFKLYQTGPGTALMGYTTTATGTTRGVYGRVDSPNGDGLQGRNAGAAGTGAAVRAYGGNNVGLDASTDNNTRNAVSAIHNGSGAGVYGFSASGYGVRGASTSAYGVYSTSTSGYGVLGFSASGIGALGHSTSGFGVYGSSSSSYAGYFQGPVYVSGLLTKAGGGFKIDHPLDPANKCLTHSFVESPDMKNVYDGVVTLDAGGEAKVQLPNYFEALNRDARIQLTAVGAFSPLYVKSKVAGGSFTIAGGTSGQEVYWQLTGIRRDPFAEAHRIVAEEVKSEAEQGKYYHPELYGQPASRGLNRLPQHAAVGAPTG